MYINTQTNQYPVSEQDVRNLNPNTSFPMPFVAPDEYATVFPAPQPEHDPIIQTVRELLPVLTAKGHYEQAWEIVPRFVEYTDEEGVLHTVVEQEAEAIAKDAEEKTAKALAAAKAVRQIEVDAIVVTTTAGHTFDGDERSQDRMGTTLAAMDDGDIGLWVLADNTVIQVTKAELREALRLARSEMAQIWIRPYQ